MKVNSTVHPGSTPIDPAVIQAFKTAAEKRGNGYVPRSRHLNQDGSAVYINRLFLETSPYLNQHAHNPVNWYPWGEEAIRLAREKDLPILLSVGYSTCHWCHVMEEESFEDKEIAEVINRNFIPVKVDREERPDVDSVYMKAVNIMGLNGGWPLNVVLTPELEPFFGGTYFPPRDGERGALMGFVNILKRIGQAWQHSRDTLEQSGASISKQIRDMSVAGAGTSTPDAAIFSKTLSFVRKQFDPDHGGFKGAPKFPSSLPSSLLFRIYHRSGDKTALDMALFSLEKMALSGMYDQVGGGFHRYATDKAWLVPHFEKMLYDNALLASDYAQAFEITKDPFFEHMTRDILAYVRREMTSEQGAFFSATDADSQNLKGESEEGFYFTWTPNELDEALGDELSRQIQKVFGVTGPGNFEGRNIFSMHQRPGVFADSGQTGDQALWDQIQKARNILRDKRNERPLPILDDKVITSWNALMISAFAHAARILEDRSYYSTALDAAHFILENMIKDHRVYRSSKDFEMNTQGFFEDYAFLVQACLDLHDTSVFFKQESDWLNRALEIQSWGQGLFADEAGGAYFMTVEDDPFMIAREKVGMDNAIPSPNSVALINLMRLYTLTDEAHYLSEAKRLIQVFAPQVEQYPHAFSIMLIGLDMFLHRTE